MIDSSPESSFRELDDVYLQTQTRIWLGQLLKVRLDEDLPLSDLLQDGEILFEVSKLVWDLLLTKCMELRHLKHKYGPFGSKMSSGRYRPYSNVDSFLKICKILGLNGIDLFSPSDIVEKRDIRKVCICIRALSKKTRSKQLSVPDFDMVRCSVNMPTDMVGIIRKSLESSPCTFSSSSSNVSVSHIRSQLKLKQGNLHAPSNRGSDSSCSEDSDEAESSYMGENSFSSRGKFEDVDGMNSDLENLYETHRKNEDVSGSNFTLESDGSCMGDSSCIHAQENNYISDYLAFSDLMVHTTGDGNSVIGHGEKNMFDFFLNVDSQKSTSDMRSFHNGSQRVYSDDEDTEVSSTTSMSSLLGRLLNLEFDNQFDEGDSSSTNVQPSVPLEHEKCEVSSKESRKRELCDGQPEYRSVISNDGPTFHEVKDGETVGRSLCQTTNMRQVDSHVVRQCDQDKKGQSQCRVEEIASARRKDATPQQKYDRRPLLKAVFKGTAIAGLLFVLLHINKSKGNTAQEKTQILKLNASKSSSTKQQTRQGGNGRYPTKNIKL